MLEITEVFSTPLGNAMAWASDGQVTLAMGSRQQDSEWPRAPRRSPGTKQTFSATSAAPNGEGGEGRSR